MEVILFSPRNELEFYQIALIMRHHTNVSGYARHGRYLCTGIIVASHPEIMKFSLLIQSKEEVPAWR